MVNNNDQLFLREEYSSLIISYRNGAPIRLSDVATAADSQEDIRSAGFVNGNPAVILELFRQPQANVIEVADRVRAVMPLLQASIPASMRLEMTEDSTRMIRASVRGCGVDAGPLRHPGDFGCLFLPRGAFGQPRYPAWFCRYPWSARLA